MSASPLSLARRARGRWHWRRSGACFVSFPKSGRTWTKRVLERYYAGLYGPELDLESWAPLVRLGAARRVPRLVLTHAVTRYDDPAALERFIAGVRDKRVVLQVRDPRAVALTYYFRLARRMGDDEAARLDFPRFLRDPVLGIRRVVEFLALWHGHRGEFRDYLLLRYEDNVADPGATFARLLSFLGVPLREDLLREAVAATPDTTRDIEVGGFPLLQRLRAGEADRPAADGEWRRTELPGWRDLLAPADLAWLQEQISGLPPEFGYRESPPSPA